ncbi:MAG: sigma-70 family RNA polymerase sigma factor [Cyclobacteriaceae bacterium]
MESGYGLKEEESQLWAKFKQGDENAFTCLYSKYIVQLYNYGERLHSDKALIEDSIHDFFVQLWKDKANISQTNSVKFYLYKGFKNRLVKNLEKKRRFSHTRITKDYEFEIVCSPEFDDIAEQVSMEQKEAVLRAINKLAPRQKEALTLRFYEELSYEEIASLMMLPVKSVYMLIYRAIDFLKQNIKLKNLFLLMPLVCQVQ